MKERHTNLIEELKTNPNNDNLNKELNELLNDMNKTDGVLNDHIKALEEYVQRLENDRKEKEATKELIETAKEKQLLRQKLKNKRDNQIQEWNDKLKEEAEVQNLQNEHTKSQILHDADLQNAQNDAKANLNRRLKTKNISTNISNILTTSIEHVKELLKETQMKETQKQEHLLSIEDKMKHTKATGIVNKIKFLHNLVTNMYSIDYDQAKIMDVELTTANRTITTPLFFGPRLSDNSVTSISENLNIIRGIDKKKIIDTMLKITDNEMYNFAKFVITDMKAKNNNYNEREKFSLLDIFNEFYKPVFDCKSLLENAIREAKDLLNTVIETETERLEREKEREKEIERLEREKEEKKAESLKKNKKN